jgi:hypothetical protein
MAYSYQDVMVALKAADAAGNKEDATRLAQIANNLQPISAPLTPTGPPKTSIARDIGDIGLSLAQGVVGLPDIVTGLADIPTGGRVGKGVEEAEKAVFGGTTQDVRAYLQKLKSERQQANEANVSKVFKEQGVGAGIKEAITNPGVILGTVAESVPSMLGGAGIARGVAGAVAKQVGKKAAPTIAAGIGEGVVEAGQAVESIRQASETGLITPEQAAIGTVAGVLTAGLGVVGGKAAAKLGIADVDVLLAGGASTAKKQAILTAALKSAFSESTLEELPQSLQSQALQNIAQGKPWDEGLAEAGAMGAIAGGIMGGGAGAISQAKTNSQIAAKKLEEEALEQKAKEKKEVKAEEPPTTAEPAKAKVDLNDLLGSKKLTDDELNTPELNKEPTNEFPINLKSPAYESGIGNGPAVSGGSQYGASAVPPAINGIRLAGDTGSVGTVEGRTETKPAALTQEQKLPAEEKQIEDEGTLPSDKQKKSRLLSLSEINNQFAKTATEERENKVNQLMVKEKLTKEEAEKKVSERFGMSVSQLSQEEYDALHPYLKTENSVGRLAPLTKQKGIETLATEEANLKKETRDVKGFDAELTRIAAEKTALAKAAREAEIKRLRSEGLGERQAANKVGNVGNTYYIENGKRKILNYSKERPYELFNYDSESGKSVETQFMELQEKFDGKKELTPTQKKEAKLRQEFKESLSPEEQELINKKIKDKTANELLLNRRAIEEERKGKEDSAEYTIEDETSSNAPFIEEHGLFAVATHIADKVNELKGNVKTVFGTVPNGRPGMFNPNTNTITIDRANLNGKSEAQVIVHELGHYLLDHVIDNRKKPGAITKQQQAALNRLEILRKQVVAKLGQDTFEIPNLKEFASELLSNREFQQAVASIEGTQDYQPKKGLVRKIAEAILDALGLDGLKPVILEESLDLIESIITDKAYTLPTKTMKGKGISFAPKTEVDTVETEPPKKAEKKPKVLNMDEREERLDVKDYHKPTIFELLKKTFYGEKALKSMAKKFQNDRYPIKSWQKYIMGAGLLKVGGKNFNNIHDYVVLSAGEADLRFKEYLDRDLEKLNILIGDYAKAADIQVSRALSKLHQYAEALHEPERRHIKYLQTVPLDNTKNIRLKNGNLVSAADLREAIFNKVYSEEKLLELHKNTNKTKGEVLRQELEKLVKEHKKEGGSSPAGYTSIKENSSEYNVTADLDSEDVKKYITKYENDKHKSQIDKILKALKPLQKSTVMLNKSANYGSNASDNAINFYAWENYVPLKGRAESEMPANTSRLNLDDVRLSKELVEEKHSFEGRQSESKNPIIQTMVDAGLAAARAGRRDLTQSVINAIDQGLIKGKPIANYTSEQVHSKKGIDEKTLKQNGLIFNYKSDGSMQVYKVEDAELLEAIRRSYKESHPILDKLNSLTSLVGQFHTRYNPAFPVLNYVRDALTNSFNIAIDKSPTEAFKYISNISTQIFDGGMAKTLQAAHYYHTSQIGKLRKMADGDPYVTNLLAYLEQGGRVSYIQGLSIKSNLDKLGKTLNKNKFITTKEGIEKFFDTYTDMFELSSRVAAFGVVKGELMQKGYKEAQANQMAASYVKQLANFEEVGEYGKAIGAWFMFFRPSATGAVRSIESLAPAFRKWETVKKSLPVDVFGKEGSRTATQEKALATYEQNWKKQSRAATGAMMALMGAGATVYLMSAAMAGDDDEGRNKTTSDDLSRWTRVARFNIGKGPNGEEQVFQMPWGFGSGAFLALGAQIMGAGMSQSNSGGEIISNIADIAMDSFIPLPLSKISAADKPMAKIVDTLMPSLIRPLVEFQMNLNTFGQEIYNNRQSRYGDAYTGGDSIPDMYKDTARFLVDNFGLDWSPNTIYFFANNYADGMARFLQNGYGAALLAAGEKDFDKAQNMLVFQSFFSKQSNLDQRQFAKIETDIKEISQKLEMFKQSNPDKYIEYIDKNPYAEEKVGIYNKLVGSDLKNLQTEAKNIRFKTPDLTRQERASLLAENRANQNLVKMNIVDTMKMFEDLEAN